MTKHHDPGNLYKRTLNSGLTVAVELESMTTVRP